MSNKVLVVLTGKSRDTLMSERGTAHWVLNPAVVRNFEYVICVRHANPPYDPGPGARPEPHGAAFLVGRIADLQVTGQENGRTRYRVMFESVADVLVEGFWDGSRNPVRYMPLAEVEDRGVDVEALDYERVDQSAPLSVSDGDARASGSAALTIAEAKAGLAATFGVPVDAIEITIKG